MSQTDVTRMFSNTGENGCPIANFAYRFKRAVEAVREISDRTTVFARIAEHSRHVGLRHALHALLLHRRAGRPAAEKTSDEDPRDRADLRDVGWKSGCFDTGRR